MIVVDKMINDVVNHKRIEIETTNHNQVNLFLNIIDTLPFESEQTYTHTTVDSIRIAKYTNTNKTLYGVFPIYENAVKNIIETESLTALKQLLFQLIYNDMIKKNYKVVKNNWV